MESNKWMQGHRYSLSQNLTNGSRRVVIAINIKNARMTNFETFHQLHHQATPFILANVWNVKSAKVVEACGFKAMATSSGAIADFLGFLFRR
jgi:hypothetical protein